MLGTRCGGVMGAELRVLLVHGVEGASVKRVCEAHQSRPESAVDQCHFPPNEGVATIRTNVRG